LNSKLCAATAALVAALCCGCGGDDDEQAATAAARTQPPEQFREQAEPICESVSDEIAKTELPHSFPAELQEYDEKSRRMIAVIEEPFTRLASMDPPAGREAAYRRFATALTAAVREAKQIQSLVEAGNDDTDALALPRTNVVTHQAQAMNLAPQLGLESCGELTYKEVSH
jgi:hypothetical protein